MTTYGLDEIFDKLIGNTKVQGDDNLDNLVLNRLDEVETLIFKLADDLIDNSKQISSHKSSVQKVAKKSYNMLLSLKEDIDETISYVKKQIFKDELQTPKITQVGKLPNIFKIGSEHIISPFTKEYTLEWYNKETGESYLISDIEEVALFTDQITKDGAKTVKAYSDDDKEIHYWRQSTPEEINHLGTNIMLQPNVSRVGTIKNFYGDIYTLSTFYDAIQQYEGIEEPMVLCSKEV